MTEMVTEHVRLLKQAVQLSQGLNGIYEDKSYILYPLMTDVNSTLIRRNYTVNQEKSLL